METHRLSVEQRRYAVNRQLLESQDTGSPEPPAGGIACNRNNSIPPHDRDMGE